MGLPVIYGLLYFLAGAPKRAREAAVVPCTALAVVESVEAVAGEATSDVAVRFDLTVAPDDVPVYRVAFTQNINLADLPDYRQGVVVVVQYPPDRPWRVRIVKRPTPEWEERAADARLDSVPGPVLVSESSEGCGVGFVTLLGLLLAAAGVVLPFRANLFDEGASDKPSVSSSPFPSSSVSSSTTVVSSASATVSLGPNQSFLDKGELRRAVGLLAKGTERARRSPSSKRIGCSRSCTRPPAPRPRRSPRNPRRTTVSPPWSRRRGMPWAPVPRRPGSSPSNASPAPSPSGSV